MNAIDILKDCIDVLKERGEEYDSPDGERSFEDAAEAFRGISGYGSHSEEAILYAISIKLARRIRAPRKYDTYRDIINYFALLAEELCVNETPNSTEDSIDNTTDPNLVWEPLSSCRESA